MLPLFPSSLPRSLSRVAQIGFSIVALFALSAPAVGQTVRVSYDPVMGEPISPSWWPSLTGDGQLVAWSSPPWSVPDGRSHIWTKDLQTDEITLVTPPVNSHSYRPRLSADGAFVTFPTLGNLIPNIASTYIVVVDLGKIGQYELASVDVFGQPAAGLHSDISGDGQQVVFSTPDILDPSIPGTHFHTVAVRDRAAGKTTVLSVSPSGSHGNGVSNWAAVSDDGRHVVFMSEADNLVVGDANGMVDIFAVDRDPDEDGTFDEGNQVITLVNLNSQGDQANIGGLYPDISEDGRYVVFMSASSNLAPEQEGTVKIFSRDRDPDENGILDEGNGVTIRVDKDLHGAGSAFPAWYPHITADGGRVSYSGGASFLHWTGNVEVYVWDRATGVTRFGSVGHTGQDGNGSSGSGDPGGVAIAGDGSRVAFVSVATNLVALPDTNGWADIYAHDLCQDDDCEIGTNYCKANRNSTGQVARISATGIALAADNMLVLQADQLPANKFGYFLTSQTQDFVQNPGGSQGNLCLGGQIGRFIKLVRLSGPAGQFSIPVDLTDIPPPAMTSIGAGETWSFQAWFRDKNPGSTSNFTDGVAILFG